MTLMPEMINIINEYLTESGVSPYSDWLQSLRDPKARARIIIQVDRMELGLFGDSKPIGDGLSELRIHYGPGYRVYYGKEGKHIYLVLCGGGKSTQAKDIKSAKTYWQDYKRRSSHGT